MAQPALSPSLPGHRQHPARATLRGSLSDALQVHSYLVQALCNLAAAPMPAVRPSLLQSPG